MSIFSDTVQRRLQQAFGENQMALSVRSNLMIVEASQDGSIQKIQSIIESSGFCPLISQNKINNNFVFTVSPYVIPDFFNPRNVESSQRLNISSFGNSDGLYLTANEIKEQLTPSLFMDDKKEEAPDKWASVNRLRTFVTAALSKGVCKLVSKYAKDNHPIIEIGSGIGYHINELSNVFRTQMCPFECKLLLSESPSTPVYKLNIQGIYNSLSGTGKKVPLIFALDVFDTLSPQERKASFLQLSQLQNSKDSLLIMLDTNPCFDETIEHIESLYPDHALFPYFPPSSDPAKLSFIIVPEKHDERKLNPSQLLEMIGQESLGISKGVISPMQNLLHHLQKQLDLKVISLEDFL